jgi:hypothetical protein
VAQDVCPEFKPQYCQKKKRKKINQIFFWQDWGLNWGLHTCKAGALPLQPCLQSILLWLFWRWRSLELFAWADLKL